MDAEVLPADLAHMRAALALARRGLGNTWPNPSVGCVLVKEGRVIGRATTAPGGRPHAEPIALDRAGEASRGATAYVTLEPCCHWGRTPPCVEALIAAGVVRVVVGVRDPDPRVNGQGIARLRAAGITVSEGVLAPEAEEIIAGFVRRCRDGLPLVTLKLASTLDGRIATGAGESRWITGPAARRMAHALRGRHDAVLVGLGTVLADDPDLTCRLPSYRPCPVIRVIADSALRTPVSSRLVVTARETPTWILVREGVAEDRAELFNQHGVRLIEVAPAPSGIDLRQAMERLATAGLTRVLVEGGARLAASLLNAGLIDRIVWFHAPAVMGADGMPAVQGFGIDRLDTMPRFSPRSAIRLGDDMMTEFERQAG